MVWTKGVFYAGGEMLSFDVSEETEELAFAFAHQRRKLVSDLFREAYLWARNTNNYELTESLLLQYMKEREK